MDMIYALLLTIVIEGLCIYVITHSIEWVKYNLYCNLVTNPILNISLWLVVKIVGLTWYTSAVIVGEIFVFTSEALLYSLMSNNKRSKCFVYSIISNGISFGLGYVIMSDRFF